jgi:hypothetical protein
VNEISLLAGPRQRSAAKWIPPLAGLFAAGCIAWLACPVPRPHTLSLHGLIVVATRYAAGVFLASTAAGFAFAARLRIKRGNRLTSHALAVFAGSVWFAPLFLFIAGRSAWGIAAAAALAIAVTNSLRQYIELQKSGAPVEAFEERSSHEMFRFTEPYSVVGRGIPVLLASLSFQTAALALLMSHSPAAAILTGIGSAVLTWCVTGTSASPQSARLLVRAAMTAILALLFIVAGLTRYLRTSPAQITGAGSTGDAAAQTDAPNHALPEHATAPVIDEEVYSGVILWPEVQPHTILVPPLPSFGPRLFQNRSATPLSIPFYGAYWFLRAPHTRPPKDSYQTHGNPAVLRAFVSTDNRPLRMEAHQNFGRLIELRCCSRIGIAIRNADRYFGTVSLELTLVNTIAAGRPSISLGNNGVKSTGGQPVEELMTFPVPANAAIRHFDEIAVRFELGQPRTDRSARIAIERFILVP